MKRYVFLLAVAFCIFSARAQPVLKPIFPQLKSSVVVNFGPGCRIKIALPETASFPTVYEIEPGQGGGSILLQGLRLFNEVWSLGFVCYLADDARVKAGWAIPKPGGGWQPNIDSSITQLISFNAFRYYDLTSINTQGWAITYDDISGDERSRRRVLSDCLIYESKAICGQDLMGYLPDIQRNKRADLTPYALKVLRSIEFLEDAPPPALGKP